MGAGQADAQALEPERILNAPQHLPDRCVIPFGECAIIFSELQSRAKRLANLAATGWRLTGLLPSTDDIVAQQSIGAWGEKNGRTF
jgi:hypothetical protein